MSSLAIHRDDPIGHLSVNVADLQCSLPAFGLALKLSAPMLVALMFVAALVPFSFVWLKMKRRLRAFEDQLPDLLVTIAASLKAGHSFKQGLQAVVDEGHPPAGQEVKRVLTETSLGRPMDDAMAEMGDESGGRFIGMPVLPAWDIDACVKDGSAKRL